VTDPRDQDLPDATDEVEVVDAVPVTAAAPPPVAAAPRGGSMIPASVPAQAAAVAVTGFAAGAVTVAAVRHRKARKAAKRGRKARKQLGEVLGTRSFLVDIHLLGGRN
jgi:hypothetical protein